MVIQVTETTQTLRPAPNAYQRSTATAAAFGANEATGLQQAGQGIQRGVAAIGAEIEKNRAIENEARAKELDSQFGNEARDLLFNPQTGYFQKRGRDAVEAQKEASEAIDKLREKYEAMASEGDQRTILSSVLKQRGERALDSVIKHAGNERLIWSQSAGEARAKTALNDAAAYFNDPQRVKLEQARGESEIATANAHLGPDVVNQKLAAYRSDLHRGVLAQLMVDDPLKAQSYFDANVAQFDGGTQTVLRAQLKEATENRKALLIGTGVFNGDIAVGKGGAYGNNIGNMVVSKEAWADKGEPGGPGKAFETFKTPEAGVANNFKNFRTIAGKVDGGATLLDVAKVWAPDDDGKTPLLKGNDSAVWAKRVSEYSGIAVDAKLNLNDPAQMAAVMRGLNKHEHGRETVPATAYDAGVRSVIEGKPLPAAAADKPAGPPVRPSLDDMMAAALAQAGDDPALRVKVQSHVVSEYNKQKAVFEAKRYKVQQSAYDHIDAGGTLATVPPDLLAAMDRETRSELIAYTKLRGQVETDWTVYYGLQRQAVDDPEKFASTNLLDYKARLSATEFKEFTGLQATIKKGDPNKELTGMRTGTAMVDGALKGLRLDPNAKAGTADAPKVEQFRRHVQQQVQAFETAKGKKATPDELQALIDKASIKVTFDPPGMFNSVNKPRYQLGIADVPATERTKIEDALKRAGRPVTDEMIVELFARGAAKGAK